MRLLVALIICVLQVVPAANAMVLFGDVSHSDSLPSRETATASPPAPSIAPNAVLNAGTELTAAPAPAPSAPQLMRASAAENVTPTLARPAVEWFMLPKWLPGSWAKRGDLTVQESDLVSGTTSNTEVWTDDEMTVVWGHQMDRAGNVWHANFIPSERDGNSNGELVRFLTVGLKCEATGPQQLLTRSHYVVSKQYGAQVTDMFQQESLNQYQAMSPIAMQNRSSNKMFHMNGQAYRGGILVSNFSKVGEFRPVDFDRGIDLRVALSDYLRSQDLDELVPVAVPR